MNKLNGFASALGYALHVHEARRVGTGDILGSRGHVTLNLVGAHLYRDIGFLYGEHTAESTALVNALGFLDGNAINQGEETTDPIRALRGRSCEHSPHAGTCPEVTSAGQHRG